MDRAKLKKDPINTKLKCINIEPTLNCNLNCIICPRTKFKELHIKKNLSLDLFYKIIDGFKQFDFPRYYLLVGLGEPLLNKDFFKMVQYIHKIEGDIDIVLYTNGTLLNAGLSDRLLYSDLTEINFSVNSGSEESYRFLTNKYPYAKIKQKIISFLNRKKELGIKKRILLQYIENNRFTIKQFEKEWRPYLAEDVEINYKHLVNFGGEIEINKIYNNVKKSSCVRRPCYWLWRDIHIDCEGYVYPCCQGNIYRKSSNICLGNVAGGIAQILRSKRLQSLKRLHLEEKWDLIPECRRCNHWDAKPWFFKKISDKWQVGD